VIKLYICRTLNILENFISRQRKEELLNMEEKRREKKAEK
jgi:hypothetical protein